MTREIDIDHLWGEIELLQMVNTAIGPIARKNWAKNRESLLETSVRFLSWQKTQREKVWIPPVTLL